MKNNAATEDTAWRTAIARAQEGDKVVREQLITENMGLVYMVSARFIGRGVEVEELNQIGAIGLIKAIDRFDPSLSFAFSTYAVPLILGEIRRFLRDDGMIHISRQIKENARKIAIVREKMKKTDNKEPSVEELKRETGLSYEDIIMATQAGMEVDSIQRSVAGGEEKGGLTLEEQLEDKQHFEAPILDHIALTQVLERLNEEEARLISLRYMENKTQSEVARILGTNQVAVSRMERKILGQLRQRLV